MMGRERDCLHYQYMICCDRLALPDCELVGVANTKAAPAQFAVSGTSYLRRDCVVAG